MEERETAGTPEASVGLERNPIWIQLADGARQNVSCFEGTHCLPAQPTRRYDNC